MVFARSEIHLDVTFAAEQALKGEACEFTDSECATVLSQGRKTTGQQRQSYGSDTDGDLLDLTQVSFLFIFLFFNQYKKINGGGGGG